MSPSISRSRFGGSAAGNIVTLLLLLGIIGLGVYLWLGKGAKEQPTAAAPAGTPAAAAKEAADGDAPVSYTHLTLPTNREV